MTVIILIMLAICLSPLWMRASKADAFLMLIFNLLSGVGLRGQQLQQGTPNFPFPAHINQLWLGDPEAFPGQCGDIISPPSPGSSPWPPPSWSCLEHLPREAPRGHPYQMSKPPQLAPFNAKEQRLYSVTLADDWASHPISKGDASHPPEESHFGRLYRCLSVKSILLFVVGRSNKHKTFNQRPLFVSRWNNKLFCHVSR